VNLMVSVSIACKKLFKFIFDLVCRFLVSQSPQLNLFSKLNPSIYRSVPDLLFYISYKRSK
jgi:hypothetical protein